MRLLLMCLLALLLMTGCEEAAQPLPAVADETPTPETVEPTAVAELRYALHPNTAGAVPSIDALSVNVTALQLQEAPGENDLGQNFDLVAAYGDYFGWERTPVTVTVALVVGEDSIDPDLMDTVIAGIDGQVMADGLGIPGSESLLTAQTNPGEVRALLANLGYPDGAEAVLGVAFVPRPEIIRDRLSELGVRTRIESVSVDDARSGLRDGSLPLALVTWTDETDVDTWQSADGVYRVQPLLTLPISYQVVDGITVTFTTDGWPLPVREMN